MTDSLQPDEASDSDSKIEFDREVPHQDSPLGAEDGDDLGSIAAHGPLPIRDRSVGHDAFIAEWDDVHLPGPGIPESLFWVLAVFPVQIVTSIIVAVGFILVPMATGALAPSAKVLQQFMEDNLVAITGGGLGLFVLIVIVAAYLRLGCSQAGRRLSLTAIPKHHFLLIVMGVLPLAALTGHLHILVNHGWQTLVEQLPFLGILDSMEQQMMIQPLVEAASLPALVVVIAVFPAVSEELIFRGVIGRGLLARLGPVAGVILTSLLFAALHVHPAIVVALVPLAVLLHLLYLATRSFLAPMLLHFLNNAWAAVVSKYAEEMPMEGIADEAPIPVPILISAFVAVVAICVYIARSRAYFVLPNGHRWTPGYVTAEQPPAFLGAVKTCERAPVWLSLVTILAIVQFFALFVATAIESMPAE